MKLILRIIINAVAVWVAAMLLSSNMHLSGGWWGLLVVSVIFGLVNAFIRPIVAFFSLPITFITLGLFGLVINAGMLLFTAWMTDYLTFTGSGLGEFWWAIIASIIISLVSTLAGWLLPD